MRIAYVTSYDVRTSSHWSGSGHFILRALQGAGAEVVPIGPLHEPLKVALKAKTFFYRKCLGRSYIRDREPFVLRSYARQLATLLRNSTFDVVFSPGSLPITYLETTLPIAVWTDATFASMVDFYPAFSGLPASVREKGHAAERAALERCSLAIYSSEWAAARARADYGLPPEKVRVVPFGANLFREPARSEVQTALASRGLEACRLLFVGVEWERKGGPLAVAVARELNRRGLRTTLTVIGIRPPGPIPPFVELLGRFDKNSSAGSARYEETLKRSHFLVMPSTAEAYGLVYAEASAFGVPSLAARVGGVPSVVRDGVNGVLFPAGCGAGPYADFVQARLGSPSVYRELAEGARAEYESRLNWRTAGQSVRSLLDQLLQQRAAT